MEITNIDYRIINLLTADQAHSLQLIPYQIQDKEIYYFYIEGTQPKKQEVSFLTGKKAYFEPIESLIFEKHLYSYYPKSQNENKRQESLPNEEADVVRFLYKVIEEAIAMNASDIHVEKYESYARIRFRWEGQLIEKYAIPFEKYNALISRIKIIADLDISEKRLPQDGRIFQGDEIQKIDIRVSIIPSKFGEKAVLRLLNRSTQHLNLHNLGMNDSLLLTYKKAIYQPNGILLITGPTGSGKTTTLYATLNLLNRTQKNILTIEDPIEYSIEGINQMQVHQDIGLTFGNALRAFLRQDPDIIMIGEIRDKETAEIAIRAALTGHLVLSTLHTNNALDAITRLADMGIPPYLIAASLRMTVAQRLIRILCQCRKKTESVVENEIQTQYHIHTHYEAVGCKDCNFTGYTRRKAIYEMILIDEALSQKIKKLQLDDYLSQNPQISTLKSEILQLIQTGDTSLEEGLPFLYF